MKGIAFILDPDNYWIGEISSLDVEGGVRG